MKHMSDPGVHGTKLKYVRLGGSGDVGEMDPV